MAWQLEEAISYYQKQGAPADQNALINLLKEVQQENGGAVPGFMLAPIAQAYQIRESLLLAVIRRIPRLRLENSHCLELCAGPNCGRHTALADYARKHSGKGISVKFVPCMRMCGKGPNIRWDGKLYHGADQALLEKLLKASE